MNSIFQTIKQRIYVKGTSMTLEKWLEANNISMTDFEKISGVPYQRISEHIRLNKPFSEKHVLKIMEVTNCKVSPETLRPSLKPIFQILVEKKRILYRKTAAFALAIIMALGVFIAIIIERPTDISDSAIAKSQQHYEQAQKAFNEGNLELALMHLEAIEKKSPSWYESRELYWKIKEELNTYAKRKMD